MGVEKKEKTTQNRKIYFILFLVYISGNIQRILTYL